MRRKPSYVAVKRLERQRLPDGRCYFMIPGVDRRHGPEFLSAHEVPEFDGDVAYFEMERVRTGPWMGWRIVKQVEPPK